MVAGTRTQESEGRERRWKETSAEGCGSLVKGGHRGATRKEVGTKRTFSHLSLVSKCAQTDFRQAELLLIMDLAGNISRLI